MGARAQRQKNDVEQHGDHTPPNGSTVECIPLYSVHILCWTAVLSSIDIRQVKVSADQWDYIAGSSLGLLSFFILTCFFFFGWFFLEAKNPMRHYCLPRVYV